MTIRRDIAPLIEEGIVHKSSGGISLAEDGSQPSPLQKNCVYCHKPNDSKMIYRLILPNGEIETTCCAHCGLLRHRQLGETVSHGICHDFFMNTTISSTLAWYVMDTTLNVPCCQPQVLTFANKAHAEKFIKGFGGKMYAFQDAMEMVYKRMHGNGECCESQIQE